MTDEGSKNDDGFIKTLLLTTSVLATCASGAVIYIINDLHTSISTLEGTVTGLTVTASQNVIRAQEMLIKMTTIENCCGKTKDVVADLKAAKLDNRLTKTEDRVNRTEHELLVVKTICEQGKTK